MNTKLTYQSYGPAILIFIESDNERQAYDKWLSLYYWNATSSEPEYISGNIICCWSNFERFNKYLFNFHIMRLWDTSVAQYKGKKDGFKNEALKLAKEEFDSISRESFRSINNDCEPYEFGTVDDEELDKDLKNVIVNSFAYKL